MERPTATLVMSAVGTWIGSWLTIGCTNGKAFVGRKGIPEIHSSRCGEMEEPRGARKTYGVDGEEWQWLDRRGIEARSMLFLFDTIASCVCGTGRCSERGHVQVC